MELPHSRECSSTSTVHSRGASYPSTTCLALSMGSCGCSIGQYLSMEIVQAVLTTTHAEPALSGYFWTRREHGMASVRGFPVLSAPAHLVCFPERPVAVIRAESVSQIPALKPKLFSHRPNGLYPGVSSVCPNKRPLKPETPPRAGICRAAGWSPAWKEA